MPSLKSIRSWIWERRRGLLTTASFLGGFYLLTQYVWGRLEEIRDKVIQDRAAKEKYVVTLCLALVFGVLSFHPSNRTIFFNSCVYLVLYGLLLCKPPKTIPTKPRRLRVPYPCPVTNPGECYPRRDGCGKDHPSTPTISRSRISVDKLAVECRPFASS